MTKPTILLTLPRICLVCGGESQYVKTLAIGGGGKTARCYFSLCNKCVQMPDSWLVSHVEKHPERTVGSDVVGIRLADPHIFEDRIEIHAR